MLVAHSTIYIITVMQKWYIAFCNPKLLISMHNIHKNMTYTYKRFTATLNKSNPEAKIQLQ